MKKTIFPMLALLLIVFCLPFNLNAQSSEQDFDQVELMKQYIGTWVAEIGEDTTVVWKAISMGKGYEHVLYWKAKGETYYTAKGLTGFTPDLVNTFWLWENGVLGRDYGKFESKNRIIFERFNVQHTHVRATYDWNLITPDKMKMNWKTRGNKESWDDAQSSEWIWNRIEK
jgi:hypothetical protein